MAAKFEESNIALLGSDLEKNVRKAAAATEVEWKGAGTTPGIEIWRVEKFSIKKWPKEQYGSFYSGDSYIVLHTYKDPAKPESEKLLYNVHFWLGRDTTQDEAGVAAYKTVELDDLLGQLPVQFREVMGAESPEFLDLFKPSIKIMDGGIDGGFNKVKPEEYKPRLLHLKGKTHVRVSQVPLAIASLNHGDVFILDNGLELIQWNGDAAGIAEKRKASEVLQNIKDERLGKPKSRVLDGTEDDPTFWSLIGGKGKVKSAAEGGDDSKVASYTSKLLRVSDSSGKITITEVSSGKFVKSDLDSNDVFIVDTEPTIFVWIGSKASKEERSQAFKIANEYIKTAGRPFTTPVVRVVEGSVSPAFDHAFGAGKHYAKPK